MKLRNKKTGEIVEAKWLDITEFQSLAELNSEWEDYEEPEDYWYIDYDGEILCSESDDSSAEKMMNSMGNHFNTIEEAEKAVEKLKAWKRLKDKGFRFDTVDRYEALCGNGFNIPITATMPPEAYTDVEVSKDLDICFGGEG